MRNFLNLKKLLKIQDNKTIRIILRAAFSADGSVIMILRKYDNRTRLEPRIKLSCQKMENRRIFSYLLKSFGFQYTVQKDGFLLRKQDEILKFSKIGFLDGINIGKDSKRFSGFTKNQVLDLVHFLISNKRLYFDENKRKTESHLYQLLARHAGAKPSQWAKA